MTSGRGLRALAAAICLLASLPCAPRAFADEAPRADPWPLAGAPPAAGAEEARAVLDAADARRSALLRARLAPMLPDVVVVQGEETYAPGIGARSAVSPAQALRGLRRAEARATEADARTVPEVMSVLSSVAFDGGVAIPDLRVLPGPDGKVDRILQGKLEPTSIDDRPYVLRPSLLLRPSAVPPPPPPRTASEPAANRVVRGVRIEIDEATLRRAFALPDAPQAEGAIADLLARVAGAPDGAAAAAMLASFATGHRQALAASRSSSGGEGLTRVSLQRLLDGAPAGADAAATCGGLTRLLGVALSPTSEDVALVGRVEPGKPPIPLEALTLALRCVWREGRVPGCSLDPDPKRTSGPQAVRVFGVPGDSAFAKTMLDADYAMKQVVARAPGAPEVEGLVDLPAAMAEGAGEADTPANRFWLTPVPPGPGDVLLPTDGVGALFDARVRVRTEAMREDFQVGMGRRSSSAERVAKSLTERYEDLERAMPVFASLHGLFDAVYVAEVLRILAPRHPLLERAADRPYAKVDVPAAYEGLRVVTATGAGMVVIEGGCLIDPRFSAGEMLPAAHPAFAALAKAGPDGALPGSVPAHRGRDPALEDAVEAALGALAERRFSDAEVLLTEALDAAPDDVAALSLRGVARFRGGRTVAGFLDALEASRRAPYDPSLEATVRDMMLDSEAAGSWQGALEGMSEPVAESLEATYLAAAATEGLAHRFVEAYAAADRAVRVRPGSETAVVLRATLAWMAGDVATARRLADEATGRFPKSAAAQGVAGYIALAQGDARAALASFERAVAISPTAEYVGMRSGARLLTGDLPGAAADAAEALRLSPTEDATLAALMGLRISACLGVDRARPILTAQLRLPVDVQMEIYEAQKLTAEGREAEAAAPLTRALEGLVPERVAPELLRDSLARETVSILLARALVPSVASDPEALARIERLLADVEAAHPDWTSPRWARATCLQQVGDLEGAERALASCRGRDPRVDPLFLQWMPPSPRTLEGLLTLMEVMLPIARTGGQGAVPAASLGRLVDTFRGTSSAAAAEALRELLGGDPSDERARAWAAGPAAEVGLPEGPLPPEDLALRAVLLSIRVGVLASGGADAATLAPAFRALAAIAPDPDLYDAFTAIVANSRQQALQTAIRRFVTDVESDPRGMIAARLATERPKEAERLAEETVRPARERAASLGEPILTYFVDLALLGVVHGTRNAAVEERLARVRRVLEVATIPERIERLRATEQELTARSKTLEEEALAGVTVREQALRDALRTSVDVKTLALLRKETAQSALRRGELPTPIAPEETRRGQEIALRAALQALRVSLPEGRR